MIFLFKARSDLYWFRCPSERFKATSHPGRLSLLGALPYSHLYLGSVGLELEADSVIGHFHLEATGRVVVLLAESALHRILKGIKTFFVNDDINMTKKPAESEIWGGLKFEISSLDLKIRRTPKKGGRKAVKVLIGQKKLRFCLILLHIRALRWPPEAT